MAKSTLRTIVIVAAVLFAFTAGATAQNLYERLNPPVFRDRARIVIPTQPPAAYLACVDVDFEHDLWAGTRLCEREKVTAKAVKWLRDHNGQTIVVEFSVNTTP